MATSSKASVYYSKLRLGNVKAFIPGTVLDLCINGHPAPWTLILGENGLGKTTLLQCLALLRPILNVQRSDQSDAQEPEWVEPALPDYSDDLLVQLGRTGDGLKVRLEADFVIGQSLRPTEKLKGRPPVVSTWATFTTTTKDFNEFGISREKRTGFVEPLLVAYGAGRHASYNGDEAVSEDEDPAGSLFDPAVEFLDAVQILENLDHLRLRKEKRAASLYRSVMKALALILPDVDGPERIKVHGPPIPGRPNAPTGVWVETYSGAVPLSSLSVGYQTMFAWTVDLAWRMAEYHKDSKNPLREPAIVLIDELDLHLHPKWQRRIRRDLANVFPHVQFIVTTHSPVLAQTYLDTNIAVVTRDGDHAKIENEPKVVLSWRLDQVSESLLHDLNPYAPEIVEAFETRRLLLGKEKLSKYDKAQLVTANSLIATITSDESADDKEAMDLIREAARLLGQNKQ